MRWLALFCLAASSALVRAKATGPLPAQGRSSVCYDGLGCFSNSAPFFALYRPLSFLPQSPQLINPKFLLYTRESPTTAQRLHGTDSAGLKESHFKASRPTKFIVHGFIDNTNMAVWLDQMSAEFLKQGDYNVVVVDWGHGSLALYGQATANTRVVGAMIAQLITLMQNTTGARPEDMHVIGHSLGAHIAGYVGERLRYLGRITGMDPAEPYFQNMDKVVRLDPTDALFVDVIHTDGASFYSKDFGLGMSQACGHVDFYINGGHDQPGCTEGPLSKLVQFGLLEGTREFVACNHMRSYHLFIESINSHCPFEGYRCNTEDDFNAGKCLPCSGEECGFMGFHADKVKPTRAPATNKYYLKTGSRTPYCRYHYKVAVTMANTRNAHQEWGKMYATVTGSTGQISEVALTKSSISIEPGKTYQYMLTSPSELGEIRDVNFRWVHDTQLLDPSSWNVLWLRHPTLYVDSINVISGEAKRTLNLCGHAVAVETDSPHMFGSKC